MLSIGCSSRRALAQHGRPTRGSGGPLWLCFDSEDAVSDGGDVGIREITVKIHRGQVTCVAFDMDLEDGQCTQCAAALLS